MPVQVQHVLCPIDFSEGSRHALDHAVAIARWQEARLTVLYVQKTAVPAYGAPYVGWEGIQPIILTVAEREGLLRRLDAEVAEDRVKAHLHIEAVLDEASNVPEAIVSRAHSTAVDLIVIGTHGRTGFERLLLGSVAEKVLRKAGCPVVTVPPRTPEAVPRQAGSLHRIICPVDFSPSAEGALQYAAALAHQTQARLTVLHVVEPIPDYPEYAGAIDLTELRDESFRRSRAQLAQSVKESVREICPVDQLVLVGRSHVEILRVADDQAADLIVMGVRGRGAADLMFLGSTTNHVVRGAQCPVLTVKN